MATIVTQANIAVTLSNGPVWQSETMLNTGISQQVLNTVHGTKINESANCELWYLILSITIKDRMTHQTQKASR